MIIFDLDGTLCDIEHRRHLVTAPRSDWTAFYKACVQDTPKPAVLKVLYSMVRTNHEVQIWSGREESVRKETRHWFLKHAPYIDSYGILLRMRATGDYTPDDELKMKWLDEALANGRKIDIVFDDRDKVVAMWRRRGITCAQVAPGDF
jgi:FMN phosphatase YigB (HAD superfamily)